MAARLSLAEREEIALGRAADLSIRKIAELIGRAPSTVSREIANHSFEWYGAPYRAVLAHASSKRAHRRPKTARLAKGGPGPRKLVLAKLRKRWSPEQIAAWLRRRHPQDRTMWVSHETIYQAVYVQSRGNLRAELAGQKALRSGRRARKPRDAAAGPLRSSRPWLGLNISQRPAEVADRAVPGHWEGDLILGGRSSAIATLVERSSRFVILVSLPEGWPSQQVAQRLAAAMSRLPEQLRRSLTWDQGTEMAAHADFTVATDCPVFFCDPHSPWQRGSNENTNRLLRDYFPKGKTNFRTIDQAELDRVAEELNTRPRQTLDWQTPAEALDGFLVASTG